MLDRAQTLILENEAEEQKGIFVGREAGRIIQAQIVARLEALPRNTVLPVDFERSCSGFFLKIGKGINRGKHQRSRWIA